MNFKKFISGISALTIAASAFAGMAVTASAATDTYSIVFGTAVTEGDVITGVNDQTDFTGVSNNKTLESDITDGSYTISGSVLCGNRTASGTTYNFSTAAIKGKVKFRTYITGQGYTTNKPEWDILGTVDGSSKQVLYGIGNLPKDSGEIPLLSVYSGTEDGTDTYNQQKATVSAPRNQSRIYVYDITIDLDTREVSYTLAARRYSNGTFSTYKGTYKLPDNVANITGVHFARNGSNSGQDFWMDNMAFYNVISYYDVTTSDSDSATVSADNVSAAYGDTVTVTATAKDGYVNPVINVTDSNGNAVEVAADGTFTMPASDVNVTATAGVAGAAESLKINYINSADDTELQASKTVALTDKVEGESASYSYPKYIVKDGALYEADAASYSQSTVLLAGETSVDVKYTATETTGYFYEGEDNGSDGTKITNAKLSGGVAVRHISGSKGSYRVITAKVPAAGVYKVTVCGLTNGAGKGSKLNVYKNSADDENKLAEIDINSNTVNSIKTQDIGTVALDANDSIIVQGNDDNAAVDYILLEKTAELPVTATITSVSDVQSFDAEDAEDEAVTAAVLNINVANGSAALNVTYNSKTVAPSGTFSGDVQFGVIVPQVDTLETGDFAVAIAE